METAGILDLKVVWCNCSIQPFRNTTVSLLLGIGRNCSDHRKTSDNPETRNTHCDLGDGCQRNIQIKEAWQWARRCMEMVDSRVHLRWESKRSSRHLCTEFFTVKPTQVLPAVTAGSSAPKLSLSLAKWLLSLPAGFPEVTKLFGNQFLHVLGSVNPGWVEERLQWHLQQLYMKPKKIC